MLNLGVASIILKKFQHWTLAYCISCRSWREFNHWVGISQLLICCFLWSMLDLLSRAGTCGLHIVKTLLNKWSLRSKFSFMVPHNRSTKEDSNSHMAWIQGAWSGVEEDVDWGVCTIGVVWVCWWLPRGLRKPASVWGSVWTVWEDWTVAMV